ncbi:hypothetical protein QP902_09910 [Corynebacterium marquesiae]|uniref:hypothetical protein n=1 Tax=Corynebacterium marquesiae TaxID=2913503 RepID=UPI0020454A27|nr:hypothetical protein [Corynebacterium marquesiae]MDK8668985.1 hypothetical protein [Corynebacterium marquesiae]DAM79431.1 MAG TPA: hypothetical protein [Caudoviricetes sp.]
MALEKFHFEASDGTTLDVHYMMDKLSYKKMRKIRKDHLGDSEAQGDALLEAALDKDELNKVENLSMRDFNAFMAGWSESEDVELGESSK